MFSAEMHLLPGSVLLPLGNGKSKHNDHNRKGLQASGLVVGHPQEVILCPNASSFMT